MDFGTEGREVGAEFALFSTENAMVSMQFHQDFGDDDSKRFVYPLLRYTIFEPNGVVCSTQQVDKSIREQGYLPGVEDLEGGIQMFIGFANAGEHNAFNVWLKGSPADKW